MTLEELQRAKVLEVLIDTCKRNLETIKKLEEANELKIEINDKDVRKYTVYHTGEVKKEITDAMRKDQEDFMNKQISELENL